MIESLWEKFDIVLLRKNHRQGEDRQYADILNRLRIGLVTEEDTELLETRVKAVNDQDIPREALVVLCTNVEVNKVNEDRLNSIEEPEYIIEAIFKTSTQKQCKPRVDRSGAIYGTPLQKTLKLKVGAKVMLTYNIDTCDSLTNGAFGEVLGYNFVKETEIKEVYVHFYDKDCGKERRKNYVDLQKKYPGKNVTPITLIEFRYSTSKKGYNSSSTTTAIQFPLKLAFAATAHKVQGLTVKKPNCLVVDLRTVKEAAQSYVILSRVQALSQIYILDSLCASKIRADVNAIGELERMTNVFEAKLGKPGHFVISCNIRSITKNFESFI